MRNLWIVSAVAGVMVLTAGCGKPPADEATAEAVPLQEAARVYASAATVPVMYDDAPVLSAVYPALSGGVLRLARLTELPPGVLIQAEGVSITENDLEEHFRNAPPEMREELRTHTFFVLENYATPLLMLAQARQHFHDPEADEETLFQRYIDEITETIKISDADIEAFYGKHQAMMGDAPLNAVRSSIRHHLMQEQQQALIQAHIRDLGREIPIALSASWGEAQAAVMLDNPLDQARGSGLPTMASFGADSCMPCQMMKPVRETIRKRYEGRLNVVYVHADRDHILASRYGIRGIPHMLFFDARGNEVHAHTGMMKEAEIEAWLKKIGVEGL